MSRDVVAVLVARPVLCPRDHAQAVIEQHPGRSGVFKLDVCPTCRGVFFDKGEITKLTNDRELEHLIVAYAGGASRMACPRCNGAMSLRPVSEVTIDVCETCHGVWMDRDEIETAARTLGHEAALKPISEIRAQELALMTFLSPGLREALLNAASREGFRPA